MVGGQCLNLLPATWYPATQTQLQGPRAEHPAHPCPSKTPPSKHEAEQGQRLGLSLPLCRGTCISCHTAPICPLAGSATQQRYKPVGLSPFCSPALKSRGRKRLCALPVFFPGESTEATLAESHQHLPSRISWACWQTGPPHPFEPCCGALLPLNPF